MLLGGAEGRFDDRENGRRGSYSLSAHGSENPVRAVLKFLAKSRIREVAPPKWRPKKEPAEPKSAKQKLEQRNSRFFPCPRPDSSTAMPIELVGECGTILVVSHWADGSKRDPFKLYAGNRSALDIASKMLKEVSRLWNQDGAELVMKPLHVLSGMRGSFNFDPRGAWTASDVGYSIDQQNQQVRASPVVEILAPCGLENARPDVYEKRKVRYAVWNFLLPPMLARAALAGRIANVPTRRFTFELALSGRNKVVTFAEEE